MVDIKSATAEIRRGKKEERKKKKSLDENTMSASVTQCDHNYMTYATRKYYSNAFISFVYNI